MLNSKKMTHIRCFFIFTLLSFVSGCASLPDSNPELKPELARIKMKSSPRSALIFKDVLYGRISKISSEAGETIFLDDNFKRDAIATHYVDITPGNYKLSARCEPYKSHLRTAPTIWMANHSFSIEPGQTITLACERYVRNKRDKAEQDDEGWSSYDYLLDKNNYSVRLEVLEP